MILRKIAIDNSVKHVSKNDHSQSKQAPIVSKREIVNQKRERNFFPIKIFTKD